MPYDYLTQSSKSHIPFQRYAKINDTWPQYDLIMDHPCNFLHNYVTFMILIYIGDWYKMWLLTIHSQVLNNFLDKNLQVK